MYIYIYYTVTKVSLIFWAVISDSWLVGTHLLHIFHLQSMTGNIVRSGEYASYTTFTFNDKQHLAIKEDQCLQAA